MGAVNLPFRLGIDTDCLIYFGEWEGSARQEFIESEVFGDARRVVIASVLTLSELLVKRYQTGTSEDAVEARFSLEALPGLIWVETTADIAQEAARLRSAHRALRLPDAIHIATAAIAGAEAFLTNDGRLKASAGVATVPILVLDEIAGTA
ncbi:MAG: type II toxin-antitoxin system VapC family toxin [Thermoflexaceae bacterium]|nr:type II toxin-antitoxin system VapC family toxin [Thermoflexaceae bacterium]